MHSVQCMVVNGSSVSCAVVRLCELLYLFTAIASNYGNIYLPVFWLILRRVGGWVYFILYFIFNGSEEVAEPSHHVSEPGAVCRLGAGRRVLWTKISLE